MSIYATVHSIEWPFVYQGSHIRPRETDPRGGAVDIAIVPDHIEDADPMVRISVHEMNGPSGCVVITQGQARAAGAALIGDEDTALMEIARLERAIREAARLVDDDSRALGMMDAADMIREARRNGLRALGSRFVQRVPIPQGIMPKTKEDT
ncbi:hypothetical protein [Nocardiopsis alba]